MQKDITDLEILVVTSQATLLETRLARLEAKARHEGLDEDEADSLPGLRALADDLAHMLTGFPGEEMSA